MLRFISASFFLIVGITFPFSVFSIGFGLPAVPGGGATPTTSQPEKHIYDSTCPGSGKNIIVYNTKATTFDSIYFVMHGDDLPSPENYYSGIYKLGTRAQDLPNSFFVGLRMKEKNDKKNFDFKCFYDEAQNQIKNNLKKNFPETANLIAFSRGGELLAKIYKTGVQPTKVKYSIFLDGCFDGQECQAVASIASSIRGELRLYASAGSDNGTKNQKNGEAAKKKSSDQIFYLNTGINSHNLIPTRCFMDHIKHDDCQTKQSPQTPAAGSTTKKETKNTTLSDSEVQKLLENPKLKIKIPGLNFSEIQQIKEGETIYLSVPFLGEYVGAIYKYLVVIAGIFCVARIIIGGFLYTLPDPSGTSKSSAKEMITHALTGLVVTISSYTILYTINPNLVRFENLKVLFIAGTGLDELYGETHDENGTKSTTGQKVKQPTETAALENADCTGKPSLVKSGIGSDKYFGKFDCNSTSNRKSLKDIKYIILHDGTPSLGGTIATLMARKLGTHYIIDKDGTIYQTADELKYMRHTPGKWNNVSIGIDLVMNEPGGGLILPKQCLQYVKNGGEKGFKKVNTAKEAMAICAPTLTDKQYLSTATLIYSIVGRTGVTLDSEHVRTHCNTAGNHGDPLGFDWKKLYIFALTEGKPDPACHFAPKYIIELQAVADKLFGK